MDMKLFKYTVLMLGILGAQAGFAKNGVEDSPHHHQSGIEDTGGHRADDPAGDTQHGTDDPPGHIRHSQGADDAPDLGPGRHTAKLDDHATASGAQGMAKLLIKHNKTVLDVRLNLAYPNPALGITDYDSARLATLVARFKAGTAHETMCELDFDRVKQRKAEYRLSLKQRRNTLHVTKGSCDGLSTLPAPKTGDTLAIDYENEDGSYTPIAEGRM